METATYFFTVPLVVFGVWWLGMAICVCVAVVEVVRSAGRADVRLLSQYLKNGARNEQLPPRARSAVAWLHFFQRVASIAWWVGVIGFGAELYFSTRMHGLPPTLSPAPNPT